MKWVRLAQDGVSPQARSSHSLTAIDGEHLVMWGGEYAPRVPVDTAVWVYGLTSGAWSSPRAGGEAPSARLGHVAAAVGSTMYVHGGRTQVAEDSSLSDLFAYDVGTAAWTRLSPSGAAPPKRNYHAACAVDFGVYVFGGCGDAGRLADLWRFDTSSGTWSELPKSQAIKGRGGPGFVAAAGSLWVLGGFTGAEAADVHRFDLRAGRWEQVQSDSGGTAFTARSVFAQGAHSCAGCAHADHVVTFGGEIDPSDKGHAGAGQFSSQALCLDTGKLSWHELEVGGEAPGPRGWVASAQVPAGLVVSGGIDDSNARLGDLFLLDMHA